MALASRAIFIHDNKLLLMKRLKSGAEYYTLVGGRLNEGETPEQGLIREIKEETGMDITKARLVFMEEHPEPYNSQYIFLCEASDYDSVAIQPSSEEALMNRIDINIHQPVWVDFSTFERLAFVTMDLQKAIVAALKDGFPDQPIKLS